MASLSWSRAASQLKLKGKLDCSTLLGLWQQRDTVIKGITVIDVTALERVDSAGLALLVHLKKIAWTQSVTPVFTGISDNLQSLITLYNLQQIIFCED